MENYRICNRCIMDTSDPDIIFSKDGICNHCTNALNAIQKRWKRNGENELKDIFAKIKQENKSNCFDCIIGISGGIDSSYLAYLGNKYGLRMLGIHIDAGWNLPISERNIDKICRAYNIELKKIKIAEHEMIDLQRAYFLAEVPNQDVPQDHAFFSLLYRYALENNIKYVLRGANLSTESILASHFSYDSKDAANLQDIHKKFGSVPLKNFPVMNFKTFYWDIPRKKLLSIIDPLDYINYQKQEAIEFLMNDCGFEYYGGKHMESRFTRLYQNYILPTKFHHDKRRAHLSSLIISGQLTREEALKELEKPSYSNTDLESDINFFISRINISRDEFNEIINRPGKSHLDYKINLYNMLRIQINNHPKIKKIIKSCVKR